jgi:hypothetical protein
VRGCVGNRVCGSGGNGAPGSGRNRVPGSGGNRVRGCPRNRLPGRGRNWNGGGASRMADCFWGWAVETGGNGVPGPTRETITGERMLRFLGHLITSRIDEKRSTYPFIISNQRPSCILISNIFSNNGPAAYSSAVDGLSAGVDHAARPGFPAPGGEGHRSFLPLAAGLPQAALLCDRTDKLLLVHGRPGRGRPGRGWLGNGWLGRGCLGWGWLGSGAHGPWSLGPWSQPGSTVCPSPACAEGD